MNMFDGFFDRSKILMIKNMISLDGKSSLFIRNMRKILLSSSIFMLSSSIQNFTENQNIHDNVYSFDKMLSEYSITSNIDTSNVKINKAENSGSYSKHEMGDFNSCTLVLSENNQEGFSSIFSSSLNDRNFYREMMLNHEMSHCITDKKFYYQGISQRSSKWINDWVVGEYVAPNKLKSVFEENFADSMASLVFLRENNFSKDAVSFLTQWKNERSEMNNDYERNGDYFEGHNTSNSISFILNNINHIRKINSDSYKKLSNLLASQAILNEISTKRKVKSEFSIDANGDIEYSKKDHFLNEKGVKLLGDVLSNYKDTIRAVSINLLYNNDIPKDERNNQVFIISELGLKKLNNEKDRDEKSKIIKLDHDLFETDFYDEMFFKNKQKNNFKLFKEDLLNIVTKDKINSVDLSMLKGYYKKIKP